MAKKQRKTDKLIAALVTEIDSICLDRDAAQFEVARLQDALTEAVYRAKDSSDAEFRSWAEDIRVLFALG